MAWQPEQQSSQEVPGGFIGELTLTEEKSAMVQDVEEVVVESEGKTDNDASDCEDDFAAYCEDVIPKTNEEGGNANPEGDVYIVKEGRLMCMWV